MRLSLAATLVLLTPSILGAQAAVTRQVNGDTLISQADPAGRFVFAAPFRFAGSQAVDVVKVAGAEQFFFVEAAADKSIKRFYWVQFEQYYPSNTYTYDFSQFQQKPVPLGRLIFQGDVRVRANYFTMDPRPGSDSKAGRDLLRARGFNVDGTFATLRMFYLPDTTKRRELMIIYGERVPEGTTEAAVAEGITARAQASFSQP
jgi:hypothetical protein